MMYTRGIRKIFSYKGVSINQNTVEALAETAGYDALTFNGRIFVRVEMKVVDFDVGFRWVETCFQITDFSDEQV